MRETTNIELLLRMRCLPSDYPGEPELAEQGQAIIEGARAELSALKRRAADLERCVAAADVLRKAIDSDAGVPRSQVVLLRGFKSPWSDYDAARAALNRAEGGSPAPQEGGGDAG